MSITPAAGLKLENVNENSSGYPLLHNKTPRVAVARTAVVVVFLTVWGSTELSWVVSLLLVISAGPKITEELRGWNTQEGSLTPPADGADNEREPQPRFLSTVATLVARALHRRVAEC